MAQYCVILAQAPVGRLLVIFVAIAFGLVMLTALFAFGRLFDLWLRSFLAGAPVSVVDLLAMQLRRIPPREIVRLRIMAVQSGVPLTTAQLQSAYLRGADVERSVLALIRAKETGRQVTWEQLLSTDVDRRWDDAGSASIERS